LPRRQLRSRKIPVRFREVQIPVPHPLLSCQNRSCRSPSGDVHLILHLATSTLRRQWRWALQERDESPSIVALEVPSALHQQNASVLSQENSLDPDCWHLCNLVGFGPRAAVRTNHGCRAADSFQPSKLRGRQLTSLAKASSVPGRTQTAVLASSGAANPLVPKWWVVSLSPTLAGRQRSNKDLFFLMDSLQYGSSVTEVAASCPNLRRPPVSLLCIRRRSRGPRPGIIRCVGQAVAPEAIAECIRSCGVWEAESNIELLDLVSTPAAADRDASVTVERINL
jgi:hypothetical protein